MAIDIIVESMYGRTRLAVMEDGRLREIPGLITARHSSGVA